MTLQSYAALSAEQSVFYDNLLLDRALADLVHERYALKRPIPANAGDRINVRRFELISDTPTVTALTEGSAGDQSTPSISDLVATVSQYGRWFPITEYLEDTSIDQVLTEYTEMLGEQAGIDIDTVVRDVLAAGTSVQYASTAASRGDVGSGMLISSAEIREVVRTLRSNKARPVEDGKYIAFVHPNTWADLLNDTDFKTTYQNAGVRGDQNILFSGEIGDYLGIRFVTTANAKVFASAGLSGADVYATIFVGSQSYLVSELAPQTMRIYFKPRGSGGAGPDPLDQISTLGYKCAFACTRLNENFMLRLEHVTTSKQAA
jgi:N4-gp56 family major capsid protein